MSEQNLNDQCDQLKVEFALIKSEYVMLRSAVDKLLRVVIDGNGHSLVSKHAVMDNKISELKELAIKNESREVAVRIALFMGIISFVSNVVILVVQLLLRLH